MGNTQSVAELVLSAVTALLGFAVVIVLAYICTKYIGGKMSLKNNSAKNIQIIERIPVSADKYLIIVESAGKTMLIGVTPQHIELISELDGNLISKNETGDFTGQDFYSVLKQNMDNIKTDNKFLSILKKNKKNSDKENTDEKQD